MSGSRGSQFRVHLKLQGELPKLFAEPVPSLSEAPWELPIITSGSRGSTESSSRGSQFHFHWAKEQNISQYSLSFEGECGSQVGPVPTWIGGYLRGQQPHKYPPVSGVRICEGSFPLYMGTSTVPTSLSPSHPFLAKIFSLRKYLYFTPPVCQRQLVAT